MSVMGPGKKKGSLYAISCCPRSIYALGQCTQPSGCLALCQLIKAPNESDPASLLQEFGVTIQNPPCK